MKICARCKQGKNESEFSMIKKNKYLNSYCRECVREIKKKAHQDHKDEYNLKSREYYANNKESLLIQHKPYKTQWLIDTKNKNMEWLKDNVDLSCKLCGYSEHYEALDCHHLDSTQKDNSRDTMAVWIRFPHERFIEKIKNTHFVYLCRNCHALLHAGIKTLEV